jgi:hypothetical protein
MSRSIQERGPRTKMRGLDVDGVSRDGSAQTQEIAPEGWPISFLNRPISAKPGYGQWRKNRAALACKPSMPLKGRVHYAGRREIEFEKHGRAQQFSSRV